jgi:hypothetical protein
MEIIAAADYNYSEHLNTGTGSFYHSLRLTSKTNWRKLRLALIPETD